MNAERSRSKGYKFLCSCPDGQRCPTQTGPSKEYDVGGQVVGFTQLVFVRAWGSPKPERLQHYPFVDDFVEVQLGTFFRSGWDSLGWAYRTKTPMQQQDNTTMRQIFLCILFVGSHG